MKKSVGSLIIGGLTIVGVAAIGYKAYKLKKFKDEIDHEMIDITPAKESEDCPDE